MGDLINGRTPEEIKRGLELIAHECDLDGKDCSECEFLKECHTIVEDDAAKDALDLIERLESERDAALAKVPKWISVEERLPEERECVFVHYVDGWMAKAFMLGGKWYTISGETSWLSVTYWMPMPEPPKEDK